MTVVPVRASLCGWSIEDVWTVVCDTVGVGSNFEVCVSVVKSVVCPNSWTVVDVEVFWGEIPPVAVVVGVSCSLWVVARSIIIASTSIEVVVGGEVSVGVLQIELSVAIQVKHVGWLSKAHDIVWLSHPEVTGQQEVVLGVGYKFVG